MDKFKVGDRVRRVKGGWTDAPNGYETEVLDGKPVGPEIIWFAGKEGNAMYGDSDNWELVAGPVRERTVKEIVSGKYGRLGTLGIAPNGVNSRSAAVTLETRFYTQSDLREIASLISATADALDEAA